MLIKIKPFANFHCSATDCECTAAAAAECASPNEVSSLIPTARTRQSESRLSRDMFS